jgi:pyruvate/2-oxoglutarate dehydrogenase complex dihydrolipoamide acyltransferase (E2) component
VRIHDAADDIRMAEKADLSAGETKTSFSAAALQLIEKEHLDKAIFSGRDYVALEDVKKIIKSPQASKSEGHQAQPPLAPELNDLVNSGQVRLQKIAKAKLQEIGNLNDVQAANLNCTLAVAVKTEGILSFAQSYLSIFKDSLLPFVLYEVARLLMKYPEFNAFFTDDQLAFYNSIGLGLAVDLGEGLKVIRLREADRKSLKEIEADILSAANKYLDKKLTQDDVSGITFTVTDLSREGVYFFTPLINKRQAAILGISAVDDQLKRCILTLTFDHRVSDGKKASEFMSELKNRLEAYGLSRPQAEDQMADNAAGPLKCDNCLISLEEIKEIGGLGLLKIIDKDKKGKYLCQTCFQGWK